MVRNVEREIRGEEVEQIEQENKGNECIGEVIS